MKSNYNYIIFGFVYICLFILSWPLYKYIIDIDGIGYANISQNYYDGHFKEAINGYWSPLHSWIVLPLLYFKIPVVSAFKISNLFIGLGIIYVFKKILNRYQVGGKAESVLYVILVISLLFFSYYELAADLLVTYIMLTYLYISSEEKFTQNIYANISAGILGALGYLSKAYALPFFLLHFSLIHIIYGSKNNIIKWILGVTFCSLISAPWIICLYYKYGFLTIGTTGKLNHSWYLVPIRNLNVYFYPPPHLYAFSWWEDPWYMQDKFYTAFSSIKTITKQILRFAHNTFLLIVITIKISILCPVIIFISTTDALIRKNKSVIFFCVTFITLSCGYLLVHIEYRFLWAMMPLVLVITYKYLSYLMSLINTTKKKRLFVWIFFASSFLIHPLYMLYDFSYRQKDWHDQAAIIKNKYGQIKFTSNKETERCSIIGFLNKSPYWEPAPHTKELNQLIQKDIIKKTDAFFFFYDSETEKNDFLSHNTIANYSIVTNPFSGLLVAIWKK